MNGGQTSDPKFGDDSDAASASQVEQSSGAFNDGCEDLSANKEFDKFWEYLMESKNSDFRLKLSSKQKSASGPWFHRYRTREDDI